jgi:DNA modification methylase
MIQPDYISPDGTVRLYCGDCLDVLPTLEAGSVDAVVTDPPYGIGYKYVNGKEKASTPQEYITFLRPILNAVDALARPGAFFAAWQAHKNLRFAWDWFGEDVLIYAACKNFCQLLPSPIQMNGYDPVAMKYYPGESPRKTATPKRSLNWSLANTANMKARGIERGHPCPRPIEHAEQIIGNFTQDDAIVLDPFMGSGTTGVACVKTGRKFIGIEKERTYFDIAVKRIEQAFADQALCTEVA